MSSNIRKYQNGGSTAHQIKQQLTVEAGKENNPYGNQYSNSKQAGIDGANSLSETDRAFWHDVSGNDLF